MIFLRSCDILNIAEHRAPPVIDSLEIAPLPSSLLPQTALTYTIAPTDIVSSSGSATKTYAPPTTDPLRNVYVDSTDTGLIVLNKWLDRKRGEWESAPYRSSLSRALINLHHVEPARSSVLTLGTAGSGKQGSSSLNIRKLIDLC